MAELIQDADLRSQGDYLPVDEQPAVAVAVEVDPAAVAQYRTIVLALLTPQDCEAAAAGFTPAERDRHVMHAQYRAENIARRAELLETIERCAVELKRLNAIDWPHLSVAGWLDGRNLADVLLVDLYDALFRAKNSLNPTFSWPDENRVSMESMEAKRELSIVTSSLRASTDASIGPRLEYLERTAAVLESQNADSSKLRDEAVELRGTDGPENRLENMGFDHIVAKAPVNPFPDSSRRGY